MPNIMRYICSQRGGVQSQNFDCDDNDDVVVGVSAGVIGAAGADAAVVTVETSF